MRCRKKPVVVEAHQWFKNGDHPLDYSKPVLDPYGQPNGITAEYRKENNWEGDVVRHFSRPEPEYSADLKHDKCGRVWYDHGWIDTLEGGHTVCPGSWIITGVRNERYPCEESIFAETYDEVLDESDEICNIADHQRQCRAHNCEPEILG